MSLKLKGISKSFGSLVANKSIASLAVKDPNDLVIPFNSNDISSPINWQLNRNWVS